MYFYKFTHAQIVLDSGQKIPTTEAVKALFSEPKIVAALGVFDAMDLRAKMIDVAGHLGRVGELRDAEFAVLKEVCTRPTVFIPAFVTSTDGVAFLRAIASASPDAVNPPSPGERHKKKR